MNAKRSRANHKKYVISTDLEDRGYLFNKENAWNSSSLWLHHIHLRVPDIPGVNLNFAFF